MKLRMSAVHYVSQPLVILKNKLYNKYILMVYYLTHTYFKKKTFKWNLNVKAIPLQKKYYLLFVAVLFNLHQFW